MSELVDFFKHLHGQHGQGSSSYRSVIEFAWIIFGIGQQLWDGVDREVGGNHHNHAGVADTGHRYKIFECVVGQFFVDVRADHHGRERGDHQGVAVGRSLGDKIGP